MNANPVEELSLRAACHFGKKRVRAVAIDFAKPVEQIRSTGTRLAPLHRYCDD